METKDIARVTEVSTNVSRMCEHCDYWLNSEALSAGINHYIDVHQYKLIHVGTETTRDNDGEVSHSTIAVLGSVSPPPLRDPEEMMGRFLDQLDTKL